MAQHRQSLVVMEASSGIYIVVSKKYLALTIYDRLVYSVTKYPATKVISHMLAEKVLSGVEPVIV